MLNSKSYIFNTVCMQASDCIINLNRRNNVSIRVIWPILSTALKTILSFLGFLTSADIQ